MADIRPGSRGVPATHEEKINRYDPPVSIGKDPPDTRPRVSEFKKGLVRAIWNMELKDK
jgi:hypothetical protein